MANLVAGVQRIGTYLGTTSFICTGSVFAVGTTKVSTINSSGSPIAWRNGTTFNNLGGTGKDEISPGAAIIVNPTSNISTDDSLFAFGTPISVGSTPKYFGKMFI
jgi:hypothetical protein